MRAQAPIDRIPTQTSSVSVASSVLWLEPGDPPCLCPPILPHHPCHFTLSHSEFTATASALPPFPSIHPIFLHSFHGFFKVQIYSCPLTTCTLQSSFLLASETASQTPENHAPGAGLSHPPVISWSLASEHFAVPWWGQPATSLRILMMLFSGPLSGPSPRRSSPHPTPDSPYSVHSVEVI